MNLFLMAVCFFTVAYLIGSLNFSVIFSKYILKKDVRHFGSGNAGFTNMLRNFGKGWGAAVMICDVLKTIASVLAARIITGEPVVIVAAAVGVIAGHDFPLYYKFKGGKGVLATIASMVVINPAIGFLGVAVILSVIFISGYVSLGSLTVYLFYFVAMLICYIDVPVYYIFALCACILGFWLHKSNIKRLVSGTENSFKKKKK